MIPILSTDAFRGPSTLLLDMGGKTAQPVFIGRVIWPGDSVPTDAVVKPYEAGTCGVANEAIGYIANSLLGIAQPERAAILLLTEDSIAGLGFPTEKFIDRDSGLCLSWVTTHEQGTKPFRYIRRTSTFSEKQLKAFYRSRFCRQLASVDHVTGNNDRNEGNFLYFDELHYLAIDQGCVGGGIYWHILSPDSNPKNEIRALAQSECSSSEWAIWVSETLTEHQRTQQTWAMVDSKIGEIVTDLLDADDLQTIVEYMDRRVSGSRLAESLGRLL